MEKPLINIKELSPIVLSIIEKVQILDSSLKTKQEKINCTNELQNIALKFRAFLEKAISLNKPDESIKIFKERFERAFSRFEWDTNVSISSDDFQKHSENSKFLVSSVLKLLGIKNCGILITETYINLCINVIDKMLALDNENQKNNQIFFKLLLDRVTSTANILKKYWHNILLPKQRHTLALCLSQLCKGLPFLLKMIIIKNFDLKKFALRTLEQCFNHMLQAIYSEENLQANEYGGEFISIMDFCLNKLIGVANDTHDYKSFCENAQHITISIKPMIDEILCYGMSIYQVIQFDTHRSALMNSSLKVLKEYKELSDSLSEADVNNVKLNAQSVGESLCSYERHLNIAVLHLVLEVFTNINNPLKNIVNKCKENIQKNDKDVDDLKDLISDFDLEIDKIMQIGFFTISCSVDCKKILGIQSCLASLESLETELISCITALYIDCTSKYKSNFQYLINLWLKEITELKLLIDSILDPAGFCEVVNNQIKVLAVDLKNALCTDRCLPKAKEILDKILRYSKKLLKTLLRSFEGENEKIMEYNKKFIVNFKLAVEDCVKIHQLFENINDLNLANEINEKIDFLLKELEKLCAYLFTLVNEEQSLEESGDKYCESLAELSCLIPKQNYYKMYYSTTLLSKSPITTPNLDLLTPYVNEGILRSKKRNVLYTSPTQAEMKSKENFDKTLRSNLWEKTPISKKRSRCCKPLNARLELSNNIDLEITSVLNEMSHLNETFFKSFTSSNSFITPESNVETNEKEDLKNIKGNQIGPIYKSSGCCANINDTEQFIMETKQTKENGNEVEDQNIESVLSYRFQESLDNLSQNPSLFVPEDDDIHTDLNTPNRLNDLKKVEEKINFLKLQVPCVHP